ncbi:hypothetical protein M9H77_23028 [Catharanthus roseus]|uniref:Uncharacterized protein n=1 Tax=Catharanthus roseus TaxID=4058 RepID=A0ACC0ATN4_CATRO|nr:hypothetical protein M9H77_23028 [Catharanthus roseus]
MLMLEGVKTLKKEEVAEVEGQEKGKEWQLKLGHQKGSSLSKKLLTLKNGHEREENCSRVGGKEISFDDRLLNHILGTPENGIRVFQYFVLNLLELVIPLVLKKSTTNILLKEWVLLKIKKGQEAMNVHEEESEEEPEEETYRREMRQKKRQERVEEGQSSGSMTQIVDMKASFYVDSALMLIKLYMLP